MSCGYCDHNATPRNLFNWEIERFIRRVKGYLKEADTMDADDVVVQANLLSDCVVVCIVEPKNNLALKVTGLFASPYWASEGYSMMCNFLRYLSLPHTGICFTFREDESEDNG